MRPRSQRLLAVATVAVLASVLALFWVGPSPRPVVPVAPRATPTPPAPQPTQRTEDVATEAIPHIVLALPGTRMCMFRRRRPYLTISPPMAEGSWTDRLGSHAVSRAEALVPPPDVRRRLDSWGLSPGRVGQALQPINRWAALVALETERAWSAHRQGDHAAAFEARFGVQNAIVPGRELRATNPEAASFPHGPDRTVEFQLAASLAGDDAVGDRARMAYAQSVWDVFRNDQSKSDRERLELYHRHHREVMDLAHDTDDPGLLTYVAQELSTPMFSATPDDEARLVELMDLLPPDVGRGLALGRLRSAERRGDEADMRRWWDHYQPLVRHCEGLDGPEREQVDCDCVAETSREYRDRFVHDGTMPATSLRDRVNLASHDCMQAGIQPVAWDVDPESELGRCIQEELGADMVLGKDVTLSFRQVR